MNFTLKSELSKEGCSKNKLADLIEDLIFLDVNEPSVPVVAIDASFLSLGQSEESQYELARYAIVYRKNGDKIHVRKGGPFLLESTHTQKTPHQVEVMAIAEASNYVSNGIVLLDGIDLNEINHKLESMNNNTFISVNKVFQFENLRLFSPLPNSPFLAKLRGENSFIARLSPHGFIVSLSIANDDIRYCAKSLSALIKSDELPFGYPLTLKLAHVFSKILPYETISARIYLQLIKEAKITRKLDGRKLLIGSLWG